MEALLHDGLVRNLRDGDWARLLAEDSRPWHRRGKELLKKLATQNRLTLHPSIGAEPTRDSDWCDEAIASHRALALSGVIVTEAVASGYRTQPLVAAIDRLPSTPWWAGRSPTLRVGRTLTDYRVALDLVLRHANSIMFIDPYVDPSEPHYRDFPALVAAAGGRTPACRIEIHRVAWYGNSRDKRPRCAEVEASIRARLTEPARRAGASVEVFLWDDFHDRFLVSDIIGITLSNGFDTTTAPGASAMWARLGRPQFDDVQREFHPAAGRHVLHSRFTLP
jgi:hypothetical protein